MNKDVIVYILRFSSQFSSKDCINARLVAPYVRKDYIILNNYKSWVGYTKLINIINSLKKYHLDNLIVFDEPVIDYYLYANICFIKNRDMFLRICDENSTRYWINETGPINWHDSEKFLCDENDSYWLYRTTLLCSNYIDKCIRTRITEITDGCSFQFGNRKINSSMLSRISDIRLIQNRNMWEEYEEIIVLIV